MLHIVNGDCTLRLLEATDLPGVFYSGDDILVEGPSCNCLRTGDDWQHRAAYLEEKFGIPRRTYMQRTRDTRSLCWEFEHSDETVLWFEEDLFCQINLIYLLDWLSRGDIENTRLSLVCPAEERLGELTPAALAALFEQREVVTKARYALASAAWQAYCSPDPTAVEKLLQDDFSVWPLLRRGLMSHLERFPSVKNGLNVVEQEILSVLAAGPQTLPEMFHQLSQRERVRSHGMGDLQAMRYVLDLSQGERPLVVIAGFNGLPAFDEAHREFMEWHLEITDTGRAVAAGAEDFARITPLDRWLGGVHLQSDSPLWRWDEVVRQLVFGG